MVILRKGWVIEMQCKEEAINDSLMGRIINSYQRQLTLSRYLFIKLTFQKRKENSSEKSSKIYKAGNNVTGIMQLYIFNTNSNSDNIGSASFQLQN